MIGQLAIQIRSWRHGYDVTSCLHNKPDRKHSRESPNSATQLPLVASRDCMAMQIYLACADKRSMASQFSRYSLYYTEEETLLFFYMQEKSQDIENETDTFRHCYFYSLNLHIYIIYIIYIYIYILDEYQV